MSNPLLAQLGLEAGLTVLFFGIMLALWKNVGAADGALWVMVWCTRAFAAIQGASHLPLQPEAVTIYLGLQTCSALALIIVLARSEIRTIRQRFLRALFLQLAGGPTTTTEAMGNQKEPAAV